MVTHEESHLFATLEHHVLLVEQLIKHCRYGTQLRDTGQCSQVSVLGLTSALGQWSGASAPGSVLRGQCSGVSAPGSVFWGQCSRCGIALKTRYKLSD